MCPPAGWTSCSKPWLACAGKSAAMMCTLVGDGTELAAIRQLSRQLVVDHGVEFTGPIPDSALKSSPAHKVRSEP